jgi:hypothetical protein
LATLKIIAEVLCKTRDMKIVGTTPKIFTLFFFIFEVVGEVDVVQLEEINEFLAKNPDVAKKSGAASLKGWYAALDNPAEAVAAMKKMFPDAMIWDEPLS